MKFFSTIGAIAAGFMLCLGATSCNSEPQNQELKVKQQITDSFIHISDVSGAQADMNYKGVSYDITYDYVAATAEVTIKGLKLPDNTQYPSLKLSNIPFKINNESARVLEGSNIGATSDGFTSTPLFNSFKMVVGDRVINEYYYPMVSIEYTVNSTYKAVGSIMGQVFQGTTVTTDSEGNSFSNETPIYVLELDPQTMTAALTLNNVKFVQAMPAQTMTFSGIPYTVSNAGIVTIESTETIIPTINKVPFEAYPITGFQGIYNLATGMNLKFVCTVKGAPYSVSATLPFTTKTQE